MILLRLRLTHEPYSTTAVTFTRCTPKSSSTTYTSIISSASIRNIGIPPRPPRPPTPHHLHHLRRRPVCAGAFKKRIDEQQQTRKSLLIKVGCTFTSRCFDDKPFHPDFSYHAATLNTKNTTDEETH
jgi:hypothetical protein